MRRCEDAKMHSEICEAKFQTYQLIDLSTYKLCLIKKSGPLRGPLFFIKHSHNYLNTLWYSSFHHTST